MLKARVEELALPFMIDKLISGSFLEGKAKKPQTLNSKAFYFS